MINIENYTTGLIQKEDVFFAKAQSEISYPESGNQDCYQIEDDSFWFKHRNNCIVEAVLKYAPNNHFFDIGGGNGFVAKGLQEKGIETVLIEPGLEGCLNAKKRKVKTVVCSTLEDASFNKNSLPSVGLFDVVEHIEDDNAFLTTIHSFLKEKGMVFITVPAFQTLWSNEDVDAGHFRRYTTKSIEKKLTDVGFEIVQSTYIFSILPIGVFLFRTIPSKLGLNKNSSNIKKHQNEHQAQKGIISKMLDKIWEKEIRKIKSGKRTLIGGSCFIVAMKK